MTMTTTRILDEGYGPGAWHGSDMKAAIADVSPELAFWRPAAGRHNIAEIALHHAWVTRSVRAQLCGQKLEAFVLEGEDWFALNDAKTLKWPAVQKALAHEQQKLAEVAGNGSDNPKLFDLVLGVTCHAIYHAGQVQLIKAMASARS
jgi:hypothetical protein